VNEWLLIGNLIFLLVVALFIGLYPLRKSKVGVLLLAPTLFCLLSIAYWSWGSWPEWGHYMQQQARQAQVQALLKTVSGPQQLIDKLQEKLKHQPESARGWYLLGRLFASQSQWQQAYEAYAKAHHLKPNDDQITVNYAQSLWQLNHQQFSDEIRNLFKSILKKNSNQPDALAMLAMDAYIGHAYQQAIDYWQRLLAIVPPESTDAKAIRKAIAKAQAAM
jgi:cytochrome c-type biogenesis protein CcmH